jgi:hypothetical protein
MVEFNRPVGRRIGRGPGSVRGAGTTGWPGPSVAAEGRWNNSPTSGGLVGLDISCHRPNSRGRDRP